MKWIVLLPLLLSGCSGVGFVGPVVDLITDDDNGAPLLNVDNQSGGEQVQGVAVGDHLDASGNATIETTEAETQTNTNIGGTVETVIQNRGMELADMGLMALMGWVNVVIGIGIGFVIGLLIGWVYIPRPVTLMRKYEERKNGYFCPQPA